MLSGQRPRPVPEAPIPADPLAALSAEERARLPNLIGIGAAKCGTSALHAYVTEHPQISASRQKELKLFGGQRWTEALPWYARQFDASLPIRSETSPTYSMDPYVPGVPEQMAAVLPDPRFVYLVGDPVRRLVAHWSEHRALTYERRSLAEAIADADDPFNPYLAASRYGHQLSRYISVFGPDRILVVDQHDLRERRRETLREVFTFAGVDPDFWSTAYEREPNAAANKLEPNRVGRWLVDRSRISARIRRRLLVIPLTARPIERFELDDRTRTRVVEALESDIESFRELTGRPFDHWLV